jgi:WD40 repeat protein
MGCNRAGLVESGLKSTTLFKTFHTRGIQLLKYLSMNGLGASCSHDSTVNIWNPYMGESIRQYTQQSEWVYGLDQIDEDTLVSGSEDKTIHIWQISTGQTLNTINVSDSVYSVKSLSNGLITCGLNRNIKIYEYSTGNLTRTLKGHSNRVYSLEILNERFMVSGSYDTRVIIWDLYSYSIKYTLSQHKGGVYCIKRLSSNLMASSDSSGLIIIWNWSNGSFVHKLKSHIDSVYSLDVYDDQTLISGSYDKTIKFWNIKNGQLIKTINTDFQIRALAMLERGKKEIIYAFSFLTFLLEKIFEFFFSFVSLFFFITF